jgi:hypothetical protein
VIRTDVAHHPEIWRDLCGWYKSRALAQRTDMQAWSMTGAGAEVLLRGGRPVLRVLSPIPALYRGFPLHPDDADDPDLYRIDLSQFGLGTARVAFEAGSIHCAATVVGQQRPERDPDGHDDDVCAGQDEHRHRSEAARRGIHSA